MRVFGGLLVKRIGLRTGVAGNSALNTWGETDETDNTAEDDARTDWGPSGRHDNCCSGRAQHETAEEECGSTSACAGGP